MKTLKVGFDIGGVITKYPETFKQLIRVLFEGGAEVFIITDQTNKDQVIQTLKDNGLDYIHPDNIFCANYEKYGDYAKSIIVNKLRLDIYIDDHLPYLNWDSWMGSAPVRLLVLPDGFKPYYSDSWKQETFSFGRTSVHFTELGSGT